MRSGVDGQVVEEVCKGGKDFIAGGSARTREGWWVVGLGNLWVICDATARLVGLQMFVLGRERQSF